MVVILAVIIVVGMVLRKSFGVSTEVRPAATNTIVAPAESPVPPPTPAPTAGKPTAEQKPTPTPKLSYAEALKKYADSRIQLDSNCRAVPSQVVYKNGTSVMFDNRADVARKLVFNTRTYTVGAYDFLVLPVVAANPPSVTYLDCAEKQNVATIQIAK